MNSIVVQRSISMGHRLPSYNGICASLHGHNVRVEAEVEAPKFIDFKEVDAALRDLLEPLDHAMVLHEKDLAVHVLRTLGPTQRIVLLTVEPTTEALAHYIFNVLAERYFVRRVRVFETDKYSAEVLPEGADRNVQRVEGRNP